MDTKAYLERIGYHGPTRPSIGVLRRLHRRHMIAVPFENLDIPRQRPIILDSKSLYNKIIKRHRGGFCYELNGSFAQLLRELGFTASMLSARVARKNGRFSAAYDHMTLLVQLEHPWLADVGFGDSFTEPKQLDKVGPQADHGKEYRLTKTDGFILVSRKTQGTRAWEPQYKFNLTPRKLADFAPRCRWQQTSPNSYFTKGPMCSRLTPDGRLTLTGTKFVVKRGNKQTERALKDPDEFSTLLRQQFGISLN